MGRIRHWGALTALSFGSLAGCGSDVGPAGAPGADGLATLVRLDADDAGAQCASGGIAVKTGVDRNKNGQLDDEEIDGAQTTYICNRAKGTDGADGQNGVDGQDGMNGQDGQGGVDGQDGKSTATRVTPEPAGTNCAYGGFLIESGLDDNGNGQLDSGEEGSSQYVCQDAVTRAFFVGSLILSSVEDLALLDGIEVVYGSLSFSGDFGGTVSLPSLRMVTGSLTLTEPANVMTPLTTVRFPALESIRGLTLQLPALATLELPVLAKANNVTVQGTQLSALTLPALQRGVLSFQNNAALSTLDFPALLDVKGTFTNNPQLNQCTGYAIMGAVLARAGRGYFTDGGGNLADTCAPEQRCPFFPANGQSSRYRACLTDTATFDNARLFCQSLGPTTDLVVFDSNTEFTAVVQAAQKVVSYFWIGYTDAETEDTWKWINSSTGYTPQPGDTSFWYTGQPSDPAHWENCARQESSNGRLSDTDCTALSLFVCEVHGAP